MYSNIKKRLYFLYADWVQWSAIQRSMLKLWWRKPREFDITPKTPARKIFGSHLPSKNGAFRPTLQDVLTGKAHRAFYKTR